MKYNISKKVFPNIGETLYSGELENGLQLRIVPKPGFNSCYAVFGTKYGGAMRRFEIGGQMIDTPSGVAHFLEHKMFDMPNGDNALTALSENGADPNAFTASNATCYFFRCSEHFEENLRLLLHFVSTPYFTPETVQKEQGIIGQEIQMGEDSPGSAIYYSLLSLLYDHHPIKDKIAGTIESISHITDKTLYDCHKIFYSPSNMVLCIEGDVDPEKIFEIASEELSHERAPIPHADFGSKESMLPVSKNYEAHMPVSAPQFLIGAKCDPDASLKERLTASMSLKLLLGSSSAFYTRLYADGLLTRDFDYEADYSACTGTVMIGGESSDPQKVYAALLDELKNINETGFDPEYFNRTRKSMIGSRLRAFEDFENVCISLALDLMDGFCTFDAIELTESITKEDCENWLREAMPSDNLAMSVILPVKESD